jgi:SsrA-binding protein
MKKKPSKPSAVVNRRARYDYELGDDLVVGMSLTGREVRAARLGHVQLRGSYVSSQNGELWLTNASFSIVNNDKGETNARTVDDSPRKLLAKRREIDQLQAAKQQGMTIVPTKLLTSGRYIKLVIALGKGKKNYDKRQVMKKRDQARETQRETKLR